MAVLRFRIFAFAAAVITSILLFFGAYTQEVITDDINDIANQIVSYVPSIGSSNNNLAYMTLLTGTMVATEDPENDHYFIATRILGYQLMHQRDTKTQNDIPFVVLVTKDVSKDKRDLLESDGATVTEVDYVDIDTSWIKGEMPQWKDLMTKLRAWELTQYDKIAFLDGDFILNRCMDGIFEDKAARPTALSPQASSPSDEGELPEQYLLATIPEANPFHHYPPKAEDNDYKDPDYFNAGFFIFSPDKILFEHFKKVLSIQGRFDPKYMEQNLLNYVFRRQGKMPWVEMEYSWHIRFPTVHDKESGVASMHDKWWSAHMDKGLQPYYDSVRWKMEGFYEAKNEVASVSP